jgi:hypothetical protein
VGEGPYDDEDYAAAISGFMRQSTRQVTDVLEWPLHRGSRCRDFSVAPPYRATSYIRHLQGVARAAAARQLRGSVLATGAISLRDGFGRTVIALADGAYTIRIQDRSRTKSFLISGPGVARASGRAVRGTTVWTVALRPGVYRYGTERPLRRSFTVLEAGRPTVG